jgi:hypothetical protein
MQSSFEHIRESNLFSTGPIMDDYLLPKEHLPKDRLQLEHSKQVNNEQKYLTQNPLMPHIKANIEEASLQLTERKDPTTDKDLTIEQLKFLTAKKHQNFNSTISLDTAHTTDHHAKLNFIRPKIVQHLTNELASVTSKLTDEQIENRKMIINFFDKAGELTEESLKASHNIYRKLAEWDGKSELSLTPQDQKEIKLFLQSIISTYCTFSQKRNSHV